MSSPRKPATPPGTPRKRAVVIAEQEAQKKQRLEESGVQQPAAVAESTPFSKYFPLKGNTVSGELQEERKNRLVEIGFVFDAVHLAGGRVDHEAWNQRFQELCVYKEKYGNCLVPMRHSSLGKWVTFQRALYRNGKLQEERKNRLVEIGFAWVATRGRRPASV